MALADPALRSALLTFYLESYSSEALSEWLDEIGQDPKGSIASKTERLRAHTQYLAMAPEGFPDQTLQYLSQLDSTQLGDLCDTISLSNEGSKDDRLRRIMREIRFREGWIQRPSPATTDALQACDVAPFVEWYPILKRGKYEKDFYPSFEQEMEEIFGSAQIHPQLPIAFGSTLKIDFHIGHPQREGVGIEFKMPTSNAELQRGIGQLEQYLARYGNRLILVLFDDFLEKAQVQLFTDHVAGRGVTIIRK